VSKPQQQQQQQHTRQHSAYQIAVFIFVISILLQSFDGCKKEGSIEGGQQKTAIMFARKSTR
jgi:hypothetical protein